MLKLIESLVGEPPRFTRKERVLYDLACPHCGDVMGEKNYRFGFDAESGMWYHDCGDGGSRRMIRSTEEQERNAASLGAWLKGGFK